MNSNFIFPKWLCRLLSYLSTFTCGMYAYGAGHGNPPEAYRVVLTISFGLMFFIASLDIKSRES